MPEHAAGFLRTGLLTLRNAVPTHRVVAMSDAIWDFLAAKHNRLRDNPETWTSIPGGTGLQTLTRAGAFDALGDYLTPHVDSLLGPHAWKEPKHWGHPLITFPSPDGVWRIPASGWHVDSHRWSSGAVPGVVAFTFVGQVRPRGGGTLVLSGSHHLTWKLCQRSGGFAETSEMKTALTDESPWFADLWGGAVSSPGRLHEYLERGVVVDGIEIGVVELCGDHGDVVLMNPRCLHAPAPNTNAVPRLMLSDFLDRRSNDPI